MPQVRVEKVILADRDKVFNTVTDFVNLPNKLPNVFKLVTILSQDSDVIITEEFVVMAGREITQKVRHVVKAPSIHEVFILEGDARDSHIVENYESSGKETKITIDADFKLGGKLKVLGFLAKGKIKKSIEETMDEFAMILE
jgi:carbon monoxide dehydrogenase subunit G